MTIDKTLELIDREIKFDNKMITLYSDQLTKEEPDSVEYDTIKDQIDKLLCDIYDLKKEKRNILIAFKVLSDPYTSDNPKYINMDKIDICVNDFKHDISLTSEGTFFSIYINKED